MTRALMTEVEAGQADRGITAAGWEDKSGASTAGRIRADWLEARARVKTFALQLVQAPTAYIIELTHRDYPTLYVAGWNEVASDNDVCFELHLAKMFKTPAKAMTWVDAMPKSDLTIKVKTISLVVRDGP